MLFKGDVTTIVQKWGPRPRRAGSKMGLASEEQFSTRVAHAAFDSKQVLTRLLHFCIMDEGDVYRSGNKYRLHAKRISIQ